MTERAPPRVTSVRVRNYRALRDVALTNLTPLTVLLGPNGSGKSTVFDNLANVVQHLHDQHPERMSEIFTILRRRVPRIERVDAEVLADSRLLLRFKDAPFSTPVLSRFASDGTLKMLAYLTLLHDPTPPKLIGIEEPENFLHPRLLPELAEECRAACERTQLLVTSHSPFFLDRVASQRSTSPVA